MGSATRTNAVVGRCQYSDVCACCVCGGRNPFFLQAAEHTEEEELSGREDIGIPRRGSSLGEQHVRWWSGRSYVCPACLLACLPACQYNLSTPRLIEVCRRCKACSLQAGENEDEGGQMKHFTKSDV
jgi:hypothetical protein